MTINQQPIEDSQAQREGFTMDKHVHRTLAEQSCQHEYQDVDDRMFFCAATTLEEAREMRDEWNGIRNA